MTKCIHVLRDRSFSFLRKRNSKKQEYMAYVPAKKEWEVQLLETHSKSYDVFRFDICMVTDEPFNAKNITPLARTVKWAESPLHPSIN